MAMNFLAAPPCAVKMRPRAFCETPYFMRVPGRLVRPFLGVTFFNPASFRQASMVLRLTLKASARDETDSFCLYRVATSARCASVSFFWFTVALVLTVTGCAGAGSSVAGVVPACAAGAVCAACSCWTRKRSSSAARAARRAVSIVCSRSAFCCLRRSASKSKMRGSGADNFSCSSRCSICR